MMSKKEFIKIMKELRKLKKEQDVRTMPVNVIAMFNRYEKAAIECLKIEFKDLRDSFIEEYAIINRYDGIWMNDELIASEPGEIYDLINKEF